LPTDTTRSEGAPQRLDRFNGKAFRRATIEGESEGFAHGVKLLKKEVDPETKGKKDNPRKDNLPARVGKLTGNPANVEAKP
jgi:hypothetical protein